MALRWFGLVHASAFILPTGLDNEVECVSLGGRGQRYHFFSGHRSTLWQEFFESNLLIVVNKNFFLTQ